MNALIAFVPETGQEMLGQNNQLVVLGVGWGWGRELERKNGEKGCTKRDI